MGKRLFVLAALSAGMLLSSCCTESERESLDKLVEPYLSDYSLPSIAVAVVKEGRVLAVGAVGKRRMDGDIQVTLNDRFHIGSDTKAMTALLAAIFIEEGKLKWDSTVAQVFPELEEKMDSGLKKVKLEQLLSHTSGLPNDNEEFVELLQKSYVLDGNLDEARYWLVQ